MDHHTNLPEFHLHSEHGVNYDPFRPVTPDTLQLPKRHREHENLSSSPKRPRSVSNTSEANISTPGSRAGWIHGTEASPSPRAFADAIPPNHAQNFDGLVMDWAPTNVHSGQETSNRPSESIICYGTVRSSYFIKDKLGCYYLATWSASKTYQIPRSLTPRLASNNRSKLRNWLQLAKSFVSSVLFPLVPIMHCLMSPPTWLQCWTWLRVELCVS
ncbi:hypothetical protein B0T21DRAFT_92715 [Apiosordaria backusii]|uniref:Uncharacterized protein n=1 Tax=Apiosordaria backusii TaxID=314023 RepID=A0AA40ESL3_9PEZI|nr:hypothetical protein B0T21DRAFT_92715 [Apiosordaria backusii]